ncbi:MAG: phospholipid carrier-dependent glycosyltransferase, partial [Thermoguttaceae bacterium]|nr:phospholipid carrier-dependent glycosyltransferase [Thermoguttaceae bacterium]
MSVSAASSRPAARRPSSPFFLLIVATFIIRGAVLFSSLNSFNADPDDYRRLAQNWADYNVFGTETTPTAFRPPLYPWTLKTFVLPVCRSSESVAPLDAASPAPPNPPTPVPPSAFDRYFALSPNAAVALFHWILGVATVAVVYRFARRLDFGPKSAAAIGFLVALDPILLQQSRLVMTETLAALFAVVLLDATAAVVAQRSSRRAPLAFAALGALFGLATLCRPAFFAFAGLVFLLFAAQALVDAVITRKVIPDVPDARRSTAAVALFLLGICAAVAPWTLRNFRAFDRPILTTTHGGYTRYLAHNPEIYRHIESTSPWSLWDPEPFPLRRTGEYAAALADAGLEPGSTDAELFQNRWTTARADETIRSAPRTFLYSIVLRVGELWRVLPNAV